MKLLKFEASWCHNCKHLEIPLKEMAAVYEIPLVKIDIDEDPETALKYSIRSLPTTILLGDNEEVLGTFTGVRTSTDIEKWLRQASVVQQVMP